MGIDVYTAINGKLAHHTGEDPKDWTYDGVHGYLRESYGGGPFATAILLPEAFLTESNSDHCSEWLGQKVKKELPLRVISLLLYADEEAPYLAVEYPAAILRKRLAKTLSTVVKRYKGFGIELEKGNPVLQQFIDFVELAERVERETGQPIAVHISW